MLGRSRIDSRYQVSESFKENSIARRLIWGLGAVLGVILVAAGFGQWLVSNQVEALRSSYQQSRRLTDSIDTMLNSMIDQATGARSFLITRQTNFLEPYYQGRKLFLAAVGDTRQMLLVLDERTGENLLPQLDRVQRSAEDWYVFVRDREIREVRRGNPAQAVAQVRTQQGRIRFERFRQEITRLKQDNRDLVHRLEQQSLQQQQIIDRFSLGMVGFTGAVGALFALGLLSNLRRTLVALETAAQSLKAGNLEARVPAGVLSRNNELSLFAATFNDMADQFNRQTVQRLEAAFEQMSDGVLIGDAEGRPLVINPAGRRILGFSEDQPVGPGWDIGLDVRTAEGQLLCAEEMPYRRALRHGATVRADLQLRPDPSHPILLSVSASPLSDSQGRVYGVAVVFRDVTVERERERHLGEQAHILAQLNCDLVEADRQKNDFLASMSHELRTPLNAIIGFSQLLMRNGELQVYPQVLEHLERIYRNGKVQLRLVNDILDLAKIKAGKLELQYAPLSVRPFVHEVVASLESLATEKNLSVRIEVEEEMVIETDSHQLRTVLANLVSNAFKYTDQGEVEVSVCRLDGGTVEFRVRDTGPGIPLAEQANVFDEFRRLEGAATRQTGGTGLGLAICRRLSTALGGRISVESTVGMGSTFIVRMPVLQPSPGKIAEEARAYFVAKEP